LTRRGFRASHQLRELWRLLSEQILEDEILRETLDLPAAKKRLLRRPGAGFLS
jgi:hypothetical protein